MTAERQALDKLLARYPSADVWMIERRSDPLLRIVVWLTEPEEPGIPMGQMLKFEILRGTGETSLVE